MAGISKEGKKSKDESSGSGAQKRILQELAALRADMEALKAARQAVSLAPAEVETTTKDGKKGQGKSETKTEDDAGKRFMQGLRDAVDASKSENGEAYVVVGYAFRHTYESGDIVGSNDLCVHGGLAGILGTNAAQVARLGQAFGAPQKIALVRVLLSDGPQSGAQLEQKAQLTTGSLYHHLRELTHARVIENAGRNRYQMTELGRQTALVLMVQAGRFAEAER